jgi:putative membrane protein
MKELLGLLAVWTIVLSGLALLVGLFFIRRGDRVNHPRAMLTATALAALFLVFYLTKWALYGTTAYGGPEAWRGAYYFLLLTHTLLAALNGPLALYVIWRAFRGEFNLHKRWAKVLVPIWLYVALTGWVIYLVLKRYGVEAGRITF